MIIWYWYAEGLGLPIKTASPEGSWSVTYRNVRRPAGQALRVPGRVCQAILSGSGRARAAVSPAGRLRPWPFFMGAIYPRFPRRREGLDGRG